AKAAYARVTAASVGIVGAIPIPAVPALTMSGRISATNQAKGLVLGVADLEHMGLIRYTARDPWLEADLEFTGLLLTDLLAASGAATDATTLRITALDDYQVDLSIADARRWPIMLATRTGGHPMSIEEKGPTRIVFPGDPSIDVLKHKDLWIWQITTIEVR
ncbi:MAG: molybdopterin-dependent oxidoreductase, partial [Chloroflexi bacterium]|nr:molybdopterin-dependent oxidoreductase [Chloroflexota bacterium]